MIRQSKTCLPVLSHLIFPAIEKFNRFSTHFGEHQFLDFLFYDETQT